MNAINIIPLGSQPSAPLPMRLMKPRHWTVVDSSWFAGSRRSTSAVVSIQHREEDTSFPCLLNDTESVCASRYFYFGTACSVRLTVVVGPVAAGTTFSTGTLVAAVFAPIPHGQTSTAAVAIGGVFVAVVVAYRS